MVNQQSIKYNWGGGILDLKIYCLSIVDWMFLSVSWSFGMRQGDGLGYSV